MRKSVKKVVDDTNVTGEQLSIAFVSTDIIKPNVETVEAKPALFRIREPLRLLAAATVKLSFFERRIYWMVLKELKSIQKMKANEIKQYSEIKFEFHYSNVYSGHSNSAVREIVNVLQTRKISWEGDDYKHTNIVIFPKAEYWPRRGIIQLTMYHEVIPLFLDLSKGYSSYELQYALELSSEYAQLLYPLLSSYRNTKVYQVSLEEFREKMGVDENLYPNYAHFRRRVIDVALGQITKETDLSVTYTERKSGRSVTGLVFNIQAKKTDEELNREEAKNEINQMLDEILQKDEADLIWRASDVLRRNYPSFSSEQRAAILKDMNKLRAFIRADLYATKGFATIDPQAYVAQSVFNYKRKELPDGN